MKAYVDGSGKRNSYCYIVPSIPKIGLKKIEKDLTNNQAEYLAIIYCLQNVRGSLEIYSDSQVAVNQLKHIFHIKNDKLRELAIKVWRLTKNRRITFNWCKREDNIAGKLLG